MRKDLSAAMSAVLDAVDNRQLTAGPDDATTTRLVELSGLAVKCRSTVERDSYSREILLVPQSEAPARLALVLLRLLNGLLAIGVTECEAWRLVTKVALDSMPQLRRDVLNALQEVSSVATGEVVDRIGYPKGTTRRTLQDLAAHGLVTREPGREGNSDYWRLSEWAAARWPTVPEMSEGQNCTAPPEMSEDTCSSPPKESNDFSGTVLAGGAENDSADRGQDASRANHWRMGSRTDWPASEAMRSTSPT